MVNIDEPSNIIKYIRSELTLYCMCCRLLIKARMNAYVVLMNVL